jgi:hypothetical protein
MAGKNFIHRHEFNGIIGKRFSTGLKDYYKSTHEERHGALKIWAEKGFQAEVARRGELSGTSGFKCPMQCDVDQPHKHYVDGDADVPGLVKHVNTI